MLVLLACAVPWMGYDAKADASAQEEIRAAAAAAQRFLKTLDEGQAGKAILPPGSPLIANWSNLPAKNTRFERNGVRVGDLSAGQRAALSDFLSKALSTAGHELVRGVIEAERVLAGFFGELLWGLSPDDYWLAFFGTPAAGQDWSWQFGGHHLAVNVAVRDGVMSMSPSFIGIEPATFESDGTQWAPLADHVARGAALMKALPDPQRQARRGRQPPPGAARGSRSGRRHPTSRGKPRRRLDGGPATAAHGADRPVGTGHAAGRGGAEAGGDRRGTIPTPFRLVRPDGRVRSHLLPDPRPDADHRVLRDRGPLPLHLPEPDQRIRRGLRAAPRRPPARLRRKYDTEGGCVHAHDPASAGGGRTNDGRPWRGVRGAGGVQPR